MKKSAIVLLGLAVMANTTGCAEKEIDKEALFDASGYEAVETVNKTMGAKHEATYNEATNVITITYVADIDYVDYHKKMMEANMPLEFATSYSALLESCMKTSFTVSDMANKDFEEAPIQVVFEAFSNDKVTKMFEMVDGIETYNLFI